MAYQPLGLRPWELEFLRPTEDAAIELDTDDAALMREAMSLLRTTSEREVIRLALRELVERHRFLNWVAAREA